MRFPLFLTALASLLPSVPALDQGLFDSLKCFSGVAYAYANGCNAPSITDLCNTLWERVISFPIDNTKGGQVTVQIFRKQDTKEIYLVFPGSGQASDFIADFSYAQVSYTFNGNCPDCQMHNGFLGIVRTNIQKIANYAAYVVNSNPGYQLVISGGSLGGALAAITFAELKTTSYGVTPFRGVTAGEPRVGNVQWAAFMNNMVQAGSAFPTWIRVTHNNDSIVRTPAVSGTGYSWLHFAGEVYCQDAPGVGRPTAASTRFCPLGGFGSEPTDCNNAGGPYGGNTSDHTTYPGFVGNEVPRCPS